MAGRVLAGALDFGFNTGGAEDGSGASARLPSRQEMVRGLQTGCDRITPTIEIVDGTLLRTIPGGWPPD
jgi:hypothetical protein